MLFYKTTKKKKIDMIDDYNLFNEVVNNNKKNCCFSRMTTQLAAYLIILI